MLFIPDNCSIRPPNLIQTHDATSPIKHCQMMVKLSKPLMACIYVQDIWCSLNSQQLSVNTIAPLVMSMLITSSRLPVLPSCGKIRFLLILTYQSVCIIIKLKSDVVVLCFCQYLSCLSNMFNLSKHMIRTSINTICTTWHVEGEWSRKQRKGDNHQCWGQNGDWTPIKYVPLWVLSVIVHWKIEHQLLHLNYYCNPWNKIHNIFICMWNLINIKCLF